MCNKGNKFSNVEDSTHRLDITENSIDQFSTLLESKKEKEMVLKKGVKYVQALAYNGARGVLCWVLNVSVRA